VFLTARRTARVEQAGRRLQGYAGLLAAAGNVLDTCRRLDPGSKGFNDESASAVNARVADVAAALHQASAIVALTGSDAGRQQGSRLYEIARRTVMATSVRPTDAALRPWRLYLPDLSDLETAIEEYEAALVPETIVLP
jgi:hypothetical protein